MKIVKLLTLLLLITSCSTDNDSDSTSSSDTFLTINGDKREIVNDGDPDLRITKEIKSNPDWFANIEGNFKVINLDIYDPNNSLIANFGDYNYEDYLILRFVVPADFSPGTYTTIGYSNDARTLSGNESYSEFLALRAFVKDGQRGQNFTIKSENNKLIIEFNNLKYEGNGNIATISGRIVLNN